MISQAIEINSSAKVEGFFRSFLFSRSTYVRIKDING
jgi:hypothetical protein